MNKYILSMIVITYMLASSCSVYRQGIPRLGPIGTERDKDEISKLEQITATPDALKTRPYSLE